MQQPRMIMQRVSNFGTSYPGVARLILQTQDLLKFTDLQKAKKDELFSICLGLARRLGNAHEAAKDLKEKSESVFEALKDDHDRGGAVEIPYVQNLDIIFEGFFYNAKNIVRDMGRLVEVIHGKRFRDASEWCAFGAKKKESDVERYLRQREKEHPGYATVREIIAAYRPDIEMVVRTRNALEHHGSNSAGTAVVENYTAGNEGLSAPSYHFEGEIERYDIVKSMEGIHDRLLEIAEAVIVFGLMFRFVVPGIAVQGIAEGDRNPNAPMAFKVVPLTDEMVAASKPFQIADIIVEDAKG